MAVDLNDLYVRYDKLGAAKDSTQVTDDFAACIEGTKGGEKEKLLAAQIISQFFKNFPSLQEQALNALLDLCEDDTIQIRTYAMRVLPKLCKDTKEHVFKIADILAQLLQLEDQDYAVACNGLTQVYRLEPITVVKAIFNHIHATTEDSLREKCIAFLFEKLIKVPQDKPNAELDDIMIEEAKKAIQDSSATEFAVILPYLKSSKLGRTIVGQQEIVNLVAERAEIDRDFDPLDEENNDTDRILMCVDYVLPLFNANVHSDKFLVYYCDQILPQWANIGTIKDGEKAKIKLLQQLSELSVHCGKLENPSLHVVQIFDKLKDYMPSPPENADMAEMPNLDFSTVECLLFAFHRLARQCPDFLTSDQNVLKDFRARLTYFSRGVQGCRKSLDSVLSSKVNLNKESSDKAKIAPSVLSNINTLIRDLFYSPPVYKCNVALSFKNEIEKKAKVTVATSPSSGVAKRHIPITFDASNGNGTNTKHVRPNRSGETMKMYQPPSGKFSNNFQSYDRSSGGRGRGNRGSRGMSRGRGRGAWRK
ncbi:unnamed protein product [Brassicogethes aeneus]|uniref:Apoptosis inhibitor 5 n=1 Tax=Brassicogethes aeneus TaxID=1431903 RepID=A0A9P0BCA3_BRAAE|nr:unnamed protein product [Brassicogethes aeneus]